jgi:hypothetical protein
MIKWDGPDYLRFKLIKAENVIKHGQISWIGGPNKFSMMR